MRKLLLLLLLGPVTLFGQKDSPVNVYYEKADEGIILLADNRGYCPYTIDLEMDLKNMESDTEGKLHYVIAPQTEKVRLAVLKIKDQTKGSSFNFRSTYYWGDALSDPEGDYVYDLPYPDGESYLMSQGYNGNFSHQGKNALDFTMPEGTKVCAARDGVVIEVKEDSNRGCPSKKCLDDSNSIIIYHEDGTFSEYAHLKKNGSDVEAGDRVRKGQVIGLSGDTGFSSGPHLHFEVFYFDLADRITLKTRFNLGERSIDYLSENRSYKASR